MPPVASNSAFRPEASIAGARSAPRNRLRVITVTDFDVALFGAAAAAVAATRAAIATRAPISASIARGRRRGTESWELNKRDLLSGLWLICRPSAVRRGNDRGSLGLVSAPAHPA